MSYNKQKSIMVILGVVTIILVVVIIVTLVVVMKKRKTARRRRDVENRMHYKPEIRPSRTAGVPRRPAPAHVARPAWNGQLPPNAIRRQAGRPVPPMKGPPPSRPMPAPPVAKKPVPRARPQQLPRLQTSFAAKPAVRAGVSAECARYDVPIEKLEGLTMLR
jgi:hypothetical protein